MRWNRTKGTNRHKVGLIFFPSPSSYFFTSRIISFLRPNFSLRVVFARLENFCCLPFGTSPTSSSSLSLLSRWWGRRCCSAGCQRNRRGKSFSLFFGKYQVLCAYKIMEFSFRFSLALIRSSPGELARALKNNLHSLAQNQPPLRYRCCRLFLLELWQKWKTGGKFFFLKEKLLLMMFIFVFLFLQLLYSTHFSLLQHHRNNINIEVRSFVHRPLWTAALNIIFFHFCFLDFSKVFSLSARCCCVYEIFNIMISLIFPLTFQSCCCLLAQIEFSRRFKNVRENQRWRPEKARKSFCTFAFFFCFLCSALNNVSLCVFFVGAKINKNKYNILCCASTERMRKCSWKTGKSHKSAYIELLKYCQRTTQRRKEGTGKWAEGIRRINRKA